MCYLGGIENDDLTQGARRSNSLDTFTFLLCCSVWLSPFPSHEKDVCSIKACPSAYALIPRARNSRKITSKRRWTMNRTNTLTRTTAKIQHHMQNTSNIHTRCLATSWNPIHLHSHSPKLISQHMSSILDCPSLPGKIFPSTFKRPCMYACMMAGDKAKKEGQKKHAASACRVECLGTDTKTNPNTQGYLMHSINIVCI